MLFRRFYDENLAQASYMIGCEKTREAIVVDPNADVGLYTRAAGADRLRISHVTETHIHADFVSGARELARCTGATPYLSDEGGDEWRYRWAEDAGAVRVKDGSRFMVGNVRIDVMHTPGHTPEHVCFIVTDTAGADRPMGVFTGDFVFVGDVGRPDLLERAANIKGTMEQSARTLWRSLQTFARNDDWLQIWPGHGAGSSCGKGISSIPASTLGYERRFNWAFTAKSESDFVKNVLAGQPEPPTYFATMKRVNKEGPAILGGFHIPSQLDAARLPELLTRKALVIDTRPAADYAAGHIDGVINIPLNSAFVTWAGWLINTTEFYLLVDRATATARLPELARALALIGIDRITGYFLPVAGRETIEQISVADLAPRVSAVTVLDVRGASEWTQGHIPGALHVPLGYLTDRIAEIPSDRPIVVHCQSGSRSSIAASLLKRTGLDHVSNLTGGITAWAAAGLPIEHHDASQTTRA
jgi:hydroxyacylglutathione hydrolase